MRTSFTPPTIFCTATFLHGILLALLLVTAFFFPVRSALCVTEWQKTVFYLKQNARIDGVPAYLVAGVTEDKPEAMVETARDYLLPKFLSTYRRGSFLAGSERRTGNLSFRLLERASDMGNTEAARILLDLFSKGIGSAADSPQAAYQLQALGRNGDGRDALFAADGLTRIQRPKQAALFYEKALFAGQPAALSKLANSHRYGVGFPRDLGRAHACYSVLARYGMTPYERVHAANQIQALEKNLSSGERATSEEYAQKINAALFQGGRMTLESFAMLCAGGSLDEVARACEASPSVESLTGGVLAAAKAGRGEIVILLADRGADLNATDEEGCTLLAWLVRHGDVASVKTLLNKGANPSAHGKKASAPLHWAILYGDRTMAVLLLDAGADVNAEDATGMTPLMLAARQGQTEIIEFLLEKGADSAHENERKETALLFGINHPKIGPMLMKAGVAKADLANSGPWSAAACAARTDNVEMLKTLLDKGVSPHARFTGAVERQEEARSLFRIAGEAGCYEAAQLLVDRTRHFEKRTPEIAAALDDLVMTATRGEKRLMAMLLENEHYVVCAKLLSETVLCVVAQSYRTIAPDIMGMLLDAGLDVNQVRKKTGDSLLHLATRSGSQEMMKLLMKRGANVNAVNKDGNTPLMYIVSSSNPSKDDKERVRILGEAGANPRILNKRGQNALEKARHHEIREYLNTL